MKKILTDEQQTIKYLRARVTTLQKEGREFFNNVLFRETRPLWRYDKEKLKNNWNLDDLWERTMAAQALGYNTIIRADDQGIHIDYAKKLPTTRPTLF